ARLQLDVAGHPLDVDRSNAAARRNIRARRHRDDQLGGSPAAEMDPARLVVLDEHLDMIAVLLGLHLDVRDIALIAAALLDDDLDIGLVPRPDFNRSVERPQRQLRFAGNREVLLLALDILAEVGADDVDAAWTDKRRRE